MEDSIEKTWRTSSYTGNGGGNCVEVADAANVVIVRDTKDRDGGTLALSADAWRAFMGEIKSVLPRESHQGGAGHPTRAHALLRVRPETALDGPKGVVVRGAGCASRRRRPFCGAGGCGAGFRGRAGC
jgi:hypothetical protein